ncbi:MBL fold metallo-hydrolase [Rickettsiales endosymbiont of Trichoplax sp. H2]|uniref:MBL fold metallo-hydrolase n=1 Tax=Rickettsiales endosymbiont of Trichoplax sp. H2 TaxID=2021221 RepID=UPI0012B24BD1|nr:MBL fold metallo-hydrolase [Rickettsiales endosymbiont of Trichoplax sp. H2]MSO14060.1 Octanoyltransferase [Rickettsiales endosymbiont of Trichoplax sp. H2]
MQITILGCGNSHGVPCINCDCFVCKSTNKKNKRKRPSIFVEYKDTKILIDTSPDLRQQCLENNIIEIDAVIYTHDHSDHVAGIDDVRRLCKDKKPIDAYIDDSTFKSLSKRYDYIFKNNSPLYYSLLKRIKLEKSQKIGDINVSAFDQIHGSIISQGIRLENIAYSTDFNEIPEKSFEKLENLDVWIVDCMRYSYAPTHSYLEKTLLLIERIKPKLAVLTHMAHEIEYEEISKILPKNVIAAYDNLKI